MTFLYRITVLLLLAVLCSSVKAQDNPKADSLSALLKTKLQDTLRINVLNDLAFEWSSTGSKESVLFSRQALKLAQEARFGKGIARAYSNLGLYYDSAGSYDSAMVYYGKAVDQNRENKDRNGLAGNYLNIGGSYLYQGLYKPALENTIEAYKLYSILGNEKRMVSSLNNMGIIYRVTKEYKKALENYTEVIRIRKRKKDEKGLVATYTNISVVYQNMKDYHNFLAYSDTALQLARRVGNINDVSGCMLNVGMAYTRLLRLGEAEKILNETMLLAQSSGDKNNQAYCLAAMGELRVEQQRDKEALACYNQSLVMAKEIRRTELIHGLYSYLYLVHKRMGHFDEALSFLEREKALDDSLRNQETIRQTNEIDVVYKTAEKEKENQRLKTDNQVQHLNAGLANTQRNVFILVSVVVVLLLLFILRAYRNKQKTNRILQANKQVIEQSLHEKETLLKEVHHRVKNNLQIISSLLELQLNRISDESIVALLKESKNRIESMALIHKKLYTHNDFSAIDARGYIHDLVQSLRVSYLRPGVKLNIVYRIDEMAINTETAVPLGLIVTEVISNALKHAVSDKQENEIVVSLNKTSAQAFVVRISDNGPGIVELEKVMDTGSLGMKLVKILSRQLEGDVSLSNQNGLVVVLHGKIIG